MANCSTRCSFEIIVPDAAYNGVAECMKIISGLFLGMHDDFDSLDIANEDEALQLGKEALDVSWPRPRHPEMVVEAEKLIVPLFKALKQTLNGEPLECSFHWELQRDRASPPATLMFRHDETMNVDSVVAVIQAVATVVPELQASAPWTLTFAEVCDAPRLNVFGGGAVVFNHNSSVSMNAHRWAESQKDIFTAPKT